MVLTKSHWGKVPQLLLPRSLMENHQQVSDKASSHVHYQHTDACKFSRWTAKEAYQFMYARPWQKVNDFYSDMVNGRISLYELLGNERHTIRDDAGMLEENDNSELVHAPVKDKSGRWARVTFKIVLSYHGNSFDGWQKQPGLNTVQGLVEISLGKFVDDKKVLLLKNKNLPIEGCAVVAGRTDKGVSAFQQVCSFYTWRKDVETQDIENAINSSAPGMIKVISISKVSRVFHPNFSAKWRRYLYIFPLSCGEGAQSVKNILENDSDDFGRQNHDGIQFDENADNCVHDDDAGMKPTNFEVSKVDQLLRCLEGKLLSYKMFARDTKASRNIGPPTECFLFHARAAEMLLPCLKDGGHTKAMCIELVANRFLRKMVRVLVATAIREAAAGAEDDALLKLMDATCRRATAPPAPPDGLCLVDVGYSEVQTNSYLIP